ncbi:TRAPP II complex [Pyronema omphalodes]|nr:TRAPP II complex [Pyronema omphalodes]
MTLDSLSFIAPARLRALLCPIGRIRRSRFSSFVRRLQAANVVRLSDVTPDTRPNQTMFNPQGFPDGQLIWELTTSMDTEHEYLEGFEMHRRTFAIIAIADYSETIDPEALSRQLDELSQLYPSALYHACLIFDAPPDAAQHELLKAPTKTGHPRFFPVPAEKDCKTTSMRTLMCDITAPLLSEMSLFAKKLQQDATIESPLSQANQDKQPGNLRDRRSSLSGSLLNAAGVIPDKRKTMTGFGSGATGSTGSSDKNRLKGKGRVQISIASLHLLAGRTPDALKEYVEGAESCRGVNDHLWHGKALEGIGVCLLILSNLKIPFTVPVIPHPAAENKAVKSSPAPTKPATPVSTSLNGQETTSPAQVIEHLHELHNSTIKLYQKAANIPGESIPHISYCELVLRYTKMLTSVHLSNGVISDAIAHIVSGTPIPHKGPKLNVPSRIDISENAMRAYPYPIEMMTVLEATKVLSGIASILGAIGMKRRKALVTRELLKILVPSLIQARVVGAAEVGIHPAAGLNALSGGSPLDLGEGDVETGIMELLDELCRAYGVLAHLGEENTPTEKDVIPPRPTSSGTMVTGLRTSIWTKAVIAEHEIRSFGWPALKIQVLRNCTALCEALPDFQGVLNFTTQLLKTADMELTKEEQIKLSTTIQRTVGAARKLGINGVEADYWDQFLLRDIEFVENSTWKPPIPRNKSELIDNDEETSTAVEEITPFIYNPFQVIENSTEETILVQREPAEFKVTLQNPFEFEVEVESVTLDATGVDVEVQQAGVIIPPFRTYQVSVFATPNGTGEINITGCRIKVYGCRERSFPIFTGGLDPRERDPKTKWYGLRAAEPKSERPISNISGSINRSSLRLPPVLHPIPKTLTLTVVDSQPLLVVKSASLSQSAIMVLEGERKVFHITLKNLSDVEVDFLAFYFTDSTTGRIQQALAEKTNSPAEIYELELMLAKKRAFVYHRSRPMGPEKRVSHIRNPTLTPKASAQDLTKRRVYIPANGTASFEIEVLGKPGLTHGTIQANYSHLGRPRSEIGDRFYTREVVYPVTVTVNASIELARVDFIPFSTDFILSPGSSPDDTAFKDLFVGTGIYDHPSEYCLMLLDVRNAWPHPLKIKMTIKDAFESDESKTFTSDDILQAGHTSRIILPVKRIFLQNPYAPIPSISATQRQFVVSSTKISLEQERQSREAFWYREELLKRLRGVWEELGSQRTGEIELRGIRLTPRMVETLKIEDVGISVAVGKDPKNVNELSPSKFVVATDTFLTLATTITNRTTRRIRPILRLLPSLKNIPLPQSFDLNRRFAVNGLLQQALPPLEPGEERVVETGFVVWAKGEYEVSASVEEVIGVEKVGEVPEGLGEDGRPLDVLNGTRGTRRGWVCREVLVVVARDVR